MQFWDDKCLQKDLYNELLMYISKKNKKITKIRH